MKKNSLRGSLLLLLTSVIWGAAFVSQQVGGELLDPLWFNGIRVMLAGVLLLGCIPLFLKLGVIKPVPQGAWKRLIPEGMAVGVLLCLATNLQQWGLQYTTVAKSGFITALYVIFVPLAGLFFGRKMPWFRWICVLGAIAGLYLLCMEGSLSLTYGDAFQLLCAMCFAAQIMLLDRYTEHSEALRLSCVEFLTCGVITLAISFLFRLEHFSVAGLMAGMPAILYAGILSCGVGYTLQTVAQKELTPTVASLIMSLECVFALLAGMVLLGETLNGRQLIGSVLMLASVMVAQLPGKAERAQAAQETAA